jgi:hypothetical protein
MRIWVLARGWGEDSIVKIVLVRHLHPAFRNREVELLLNLRSL